MRPHDALLHYGKKGMQWGKKNSPQLSFEQLSKMPYSELLKLDQKDIAHLSPEQKRIIANMTMRARAEADKGNGSDANGRAVDSNGRPVLNKKSLGGSTKNAVAKNHQRKLDSATKSRGIARFNKLVK